MVDVTATESERTGAVRARPEQRRARIVGIVELAMAAFVLFIFGLGEGSEADATLKLALPRDRFEPLDWIVNPRLIGIVTAVLLILSAMSTYRYTVCKTLDRSWPLKYHLAIHLSLLPREALLPSTRSRGAPLREQLRAVWPGPYHRNVNNTNSFQWKLFHISTPL